LATIRLADARCSTVIDRAMLEPAAKQPGFLGVESARKTLGITSFRERRAHDARHAGPRPFLIMQDGALYYHGRTKGSACEAKQRERGI
jgi:hypothetical protein